MSLYRRMHFLCAEQKRFSAPFLLLRKIRNTDGGGMDGKREMVQAFLSLHLSILFAGFTGILGKLIELSSGVMTWWRMFFTALILVAFRMIRRKGGTEGWKDRLTIAGAGLLLALHWIFFFGSIKASNVSVGVACFAMIGFFSAILEPLLLKRRFQWMELAFSLLAMIGVLLVFSLDIRFRTGILLGIVSTLLASLYTVASKYLGHFYSSGTILYEEMCGGFLAFTLLSPVWLMMFPASRFLPTIPETGELIVFAVACTIGLYYFQIRALNAISAFTVNLSYNLEPVYSILLAILIFHEHREFSAAFCGCLFLLVLSVSLQSIRQWRERKKAPAGA